MKRIGPLAILLAAAVAVSWFLPESGSSAFEPFEPPPLQVPAGFEIELVAAPPLVQHPVMAAFDDQGRLFVADNAGLNLRKDELEEQLPNLIRLLEDTDGDGIFDKSTVFADEMTFPQGVLWHDGALYSASPPSIWKLEDTNGDGVSDRRQEIATGFEYTGNAADVHGPFLSPTGRLFWCHGRKGHEVYEGDRLVSKGLGARIWTSRPDGSDLHVFSGGGMDNPVELVFTEEGDIFGTVDIFYSGPRADAIVHWVYGGVYPWMERALAEFKKSGDLLPPAVNLGHVAPAGLLRYQGMQFGDDYRNNLFLAEFNTHRVMRVMMERDGSSFTGETEVFLSSTSPDAHFTDIVEDADGSLLIIDTGGWFRIGCPSSGVAKPDVLGAIYRIRKKGVSGPKDPRGLDLEWETASPQELASRLNDDRPVVRDRAVEALSRKGSEAIRELVKVLAEGERQSRVQAVWTLTRIGTEPALEAVRSALQDKDPGVRQAACRSVFTTRDTQAGPLLKTLLYDDHPSVRREAAAALGRLKVPGAVEPLLVALERANEDRMLHHALTYALIELDKPQPTSAGLRSDSPSVQRGALMALDQMDSGHLEPGQVVPLLDSEDAQLRDAALMVINERTEWTASVAELLNRWLESPALESYQQDMIRNLVVRFASQDQIQTLLGRVLAKPSLSDSNRLLLLSGMARSPGIEIHPSWEQPLKESLNSQNQELVMAVLRLLRAAPSARFDEELKRIGGDPDRQPLVRVAALQAVSGQEGRLADSSFELLTRMFDSTTVSVRVEAAGMLAGADLSGDQIRQLAPLIEQAGPLELQALLPVLHKSKEVEVGVALLQALENSPGLFALTPANIRRSFGD
ncbi:MAG TPA: PVC-type heme-binding CxxCH protein, partial [Acidobacteriota bacterium]|nr:PVC-type heme-binding CxxCH protein [Acidobacteriota bacterium]